MSGAINAIQTYTLNFYTDSSVYTRFIMHHKISIHIFIRFYLLLESGAGKCYCIFCAIINIAGIFFFFFFQFF